MADEAEVVNKNVIVVVLDVDDYIGVVVRSRETLKKEKEQFHRNN